MERHPAEALREALEAFRHDEAMERVRRFRGVDGAEGEAAVADRHRRLADVNRVRALVDRAVAAGMDEADAASLRAHLARAAADVALAPGRDALEEAAGRALRIGRERATVEDALDALGADDHERQAAARSALVLAAGRTADVLGEHKAAADRVGLLVMDSGGRPPDAGPVASTLLELAETLLSATEDVVHEARSWLAPTDRSVLGLVPRRGRYRRIADGIAGLGFERDLAARVSVGGTHPFVGPRARLILARAGSDARIFEARRERGVVSELAAAETLGRALSHVVAAPALPLEHRRPLAGSVARGVGAIVAQLLADRVYLSRARGLSGADADRLGRAAGTVVLLTARVRAALVVARASSRSAEELAENTAAGLGRALAAEVPLAFARLAILPAASGPRLRGALHGLAIAWQLRERFDEDWFANPKAAEPLRAAMTRGGLLSVEGLAEELGATPELAPRRLAELFG